MAFGWCIYAIKCPIENKIRYIGHTHSERIEARLKEHFRDTKTNKKKGDWILSIINAGLQNKTTIEIIENNISMEYFAKLIEWSYINFFTSIGYNLTNKKCIYTVPKIPNDSISQLIHKEQIEWLKKYALLLKNKK